MPSPYREVEVVEPSPPKSGELVYRPAERTDRNAAGYSGVRLVGPPALVSILVAGIVGVEAGVIAFAVALAGLAWWSHKRPKNVLVLRVARGVLSVAPAGSKREMFRVGLDELDDVVLETKAVQRHLDTAAGVVNIGMGGIAPSMAAPTDTNRIALESSVRGTLLLTREFFGHTDTTEWFAQIRRFLRSLGWTPLSEREESEEEEVDEEEPATA